MSVSTPIPSSFNVLGFVCRTWYSGQPVRCSICKERDHLPRACPLSGLCRRCKLPGHVACECGQTGGQPRPLSSVPVPVPDPVPVPADPVSVPAPVPVTGCEDDGDLSSVSSDQPDPAPSTSVRKPRVKRSAASKAPPFAKWSVPVVFPEFDGIWSHIKECLDRARPNFPAFDSDRAVNSYITDFMFSNKIMETHRSLVYDYLAVLHAKK